MAHPEVSKMIITNTRVRSFGEKTLGIRNPNSRDTQRTSPLSSKAITSPYDPTPSVFQTPERASIQEKSQKNNIIAQTWIGKAATRNTVQIDCLE